MNLRPLLLALALPCCALGNTGPIAYISNLSTPGPQGGGIGDLETLLPGYGFGVGFVTGASPVTLDSVTLELYAGYNLAGFSVGVYTFGPPGSGTPPAWPVIPYATLGQVATDPRQTLWPGYTAFYDFSSSAAVTLAPHSAYIIGVTEAANGNDDNALRFGYNENYSIASDWQSYPVSNMNQWYLNPSLGGWVDTSPAAANGMVLEVNGTPVPEPAALPLLLAATAVLSVRNPRHSRRA